MQHPRNYALSPVFEQLLLGQCGLGACLADSALARLARGTHVLADAYTDGEPSRAALSDPSLRAAYSAYYLPCNAVKLFPVLDEIERRAPVLRPGTELRVLDLGCGPGTLTAALLDYCLQNRAGSGIRLDITGIDRDSGNAAAARELAEALGAATPGAPELSALQFLAGDLTAAEAGRLPGAQAGFDLIMAGNLVNELGENHIDGFAHLLASLLAPGGIAVVLEPGTLHAFRRLLLLRQALTRHAGINLRAPCLHPGACPLQDSPKAWCHEKLFWSPPEIVRLIDERTGFTKHKGVKFSYLVAARDSGHPPAGNEVPDEALWRIVSYVIRAKGEERLFACNGRERILLRRLTRLHAPESADFSRCARGDIVFIAGAEERKNFFDIGPKAVFRIH